MYKFHNSYFVKLKKNVNIVIWGILCLYILHVWVSYTCRSLITFPITFVLGVRRKCRSPAAVTRQLRETVKRIVARARRGAL